MTDTPSSPTDPADDDLLASLYLDGEATAAERATVDADPALLARVRAFEAMADDLADLPPPVGLAQVQISAALDLFDQQRAAATSAAATTLTSPQGGVASLDERRARKQSWGIPTWLTAAAALALVVGGLGFASTLGDGDEDVASVDTATESADETFASGASRNVEDSDPLAAADDDATEAAAADDDAMEEEAAMDESAEDETMADTQELTEQATADSGDAGDVGETALSPIPLDRLDASTAAEYLELLGDQPLQPIDASPCAGSPLVKGLFGVDSFISVVFEGETASLLVQAGVPATAVIVGPTCEIELE